MRSFMQLTCSVIVLVLSTAAIASAITPSAPELEPSSVGASIGLVAAGVLIMQARRNGRK